MATGDRRYSTADITADQLGQIIDSQMMKAKNLRRGFERRWYDNNFFDDGFHFRFLSRQQNKIVDLTDRASLYNPMRAIPKASRQIRGIANLMLARQPSPVVYPEKLDPKKFQNMAPQGVAMLNQQQQQQTQMPMEDSPEYQKARQEAKDIAKKQGLWIEDEMKRQRLQEKLAHMIILTAKHGVSFMEIWPDPVTEAIQSQVFDAFDIYLMGNLTSIYDSPFLLKGIPQTIAEIKANENFDEEALSKLNPDNRMASSEIKEAYQKARFGGETMPDQAATIILKEAFNKEYLNEDNVPRIRKQENASEILKGKDMGDVIIRQTFVAGNINLLDNYLPMSEYPFVDFRFEPGPIYQVPLIERFMPSNKSLDLVASRVERYTHTMVTGSWSKRQGEQFNIDNTPGGQIIEYQGTPPVQNNIAPIPAFVFNYMNFLNSVIEEQGVTTTTLGKLPNGVKANAAIESLKESEYANLEIPMSRLKETVKKTAEKFLDIADSHFITPKTVYHLNKGEPEYFDVIGNSNISRRKSKGVNTSSDVVPLKRDAVVDIEVENGAAYTKEGGRTIAMNLVKEMFPYFQAQLIPPEALKVILENVLQSYQFSGIGDFMEAMNGEIPMTEMQTMQMKTALVEVMKDMQEHGILPTSEQRVMESKVGSIEAIKDAGLADKEEEQPEQQKPPSESLSFKDLPPEGKVQMAAQAGIQLDANQIRADEQEQKMQEQQMADRQMQLKEKQVQMKGSSNGTKKR